MDVATYRRNVFKTLAIKEAKQGVRGLARKNQTINIAHGIVGFRTEVGELMESLSGYVAGRQLSDDMKIKSQKEFGDMLYYLTVLAKMLKVKLPGSGKKIKLHGITRTEALLQVDTISNELLDIFKKSFYGREMDLVLATKLMEDVIPIVWSLHYDLLQIPPAETMAKNIAHLAEKYPNQVFDSAKEKEFDERHEAEKVAA